MTVDRRFRREAVAWRDRPAGGDALPGTSWKLTGDGRHAVPWRDLLRRPRGRRVPVRTQSQLSDCGPTSLQMVLAHHGIQAGIDELRRQTNAGRDGVSAQVLLATARRYGLTARGVRTGLDGLRRLPAATILFWNFSHFVVLERATESFLYIVDPALGRRRVPREAAGKAFTGVALEFRPPADAPAVPAARSRRAPVHAGAGNWRYLAGFFPRTTAWVPLAAASLLLILFNFAAPFGSAYLIDTATARDGRADAALLLCLAAVLVLAFVLLQAVRGLAIAALQATADQRVTLRVLRHLLSLPYDYFVRRHPGDLAMRVRTSTAVRQVLTSSAMSTVFDGLLVLGYLTLLFLADTQLALVVDALAVLQLAVTVLGWRRQEYLNADALESQAVAEGELIEILNGALTLKASGLEEVAGERWSATFADELRTRNRSRRSTALRGAVLSGLQFAAPVTVLLLGAQQVADGHTPLGTVVAFSTLTMGLFVPLTNLMQTTLQVASLGRTLARLADILESRPEGRPPDAAPGPPVTDGELRLTGVGFSYEGSTRPALRDVDLTVAPGSVLAVLGRSGSGKSTLGALIAGLYLPTEGTVAVDGAATDRIDRVAMRRQISYVSQDTRLFGGSIRSNIVLGAPDATQEQIERAARAAEIHADIQSMPMRYETLLGPGGAGISGGQRQRIALARALVRSPRLLVLDEATSALDPSTEERVLRNVAALGRTVVLIAHRLTAASVADGVVVVDNGRVVRRDTADAPTSGNG
ncbi:peptidase domain-containing ABC transporter [Kitasatospora viridis]|uniref:ABC-type bacteriocin/lantibiotic exporter with double-glycine peptidase domain n=1 Tax=Kitasatospora viridis TaxID=281105 RepID=A0A561SG66_9ACTN|nr:peptidase domain-containing ABC transporter [Kitasatospora viridis]TWF73823.1 ABC-type bacteriocin/lantibiotic exporter with double-glycine peptidase domain [Kitasatospora viridis]